MAFTPDSSSLAPRTRSSRALTKDHPQRPLNFTPEIQRATAEEGEGGSSIVVVKSAARLVEFLKVITQKASVLFPERTTE